MKWKIGNVEIKNQVILAPMAGICNSSFRRICKEMGAGLVVAEMVSDKAIEYNNQKTINMLYMENEERPISQQIFGSDPETMASAAKYIYETMKPDIIDINMGCPVPKVAERANAGSALLKDKEKIKQIVTSVVKAVPIPVTVKIRSGYDKNEAAQIAKIIESSGAKAITIHPRTKKQGFTGSADWNIIKEVKDSVKIPVIGNGDIKSCFDAKKMLEETGCDAVMIGRATLGNPWLIKETVAYLEDGTILPKVTLKEKKEIIKKHIKYLESTKNEKVTLLEIRSHIGWYFKGNKNSKKVKEDVCKAKSIKEILEIIDNYEEE